jgi:hypothetical protein
LVNPLGFASMGPRSGERGKEKSDRGLVESISASMGPRSGERGKLQGAGHGQPHCRASMGPRSGERGKHDIPVSHTGRLFASMGPRSGERGKKCRPKPMGRKSSCFNGAAFRRTRKGLFCNSLCASLLTKGLRAVGRRSRVTVVTDAILHCKSFIRNPRAVTGEYSPPTRSRTVRLSKNRRRSCRRRC